jgi:hypothetical protein
MAQQVASTMGSELFNTPGAAEERLSWEKVGAEEAVSSGPSSVASVEWQAEPSILSGAAEYHH